MFLSEKSSFDGVNVALYERRIAQACLRQDVANIYRTEASNARVHAVKPELLNGVE
jgi:hypothetical protein